MSYVPRCRSGHRQRRSFRTIRSTGAGSRFSNAPPKSTDNRYYVNFCLHENVQAGSDVYTDHLKSYFGLQAEYERDFIHHAEMYVKGADPHQWPGELLEPFEARIGPCRRSCRLFRFVDDEQCSAIALEAA